MGVREGTNLQAKLLMLPRESSQRRKPLKETRTESGVASATHVSLVSVRAMLALEACCQALVRVVAH